MKGIWGMTFEEFKNILDDAGMDFDTRGFEGILNDLSLLADKLSDEHKERGHFASSKYIREQGHKLFIALKERGYYDE